jgi:hypothetical protein
MNTASNARLRLNYPSWSRPRSHWSATDPRNRQTTFRAKTHQHTQRKLARLAACATPVRPMACAGQTGDTSQTGGQSRSDQWTESLNDFSRPWNKNTPKTQPARKKNPSQNQAKHLQTKQELTRNSTTQRHTGQATHGGKSHKRLTLSVFWTSKPTKGYRGSRLCGEDRDRETENSMVCARTRDTRFIQVRVAKVANPTSYLGIKYGALRLVLVEIRSGARLGTRPSFI